MNSGASGRVAREEQAEVAKDNFRSRMSTSMDRAQVVRDAAIKVHDTIWAARLVVESSMTTTPGDHEPVLIVAEMILGLVKEAGQANSIQNTLASTFSALGKLNQDDGESWKPSLGMNAEDEDDSDGVSRDNDGRPPP
jgi:hypothetical protein